MSSRLEINFNQDEVETTGAFARRKVKMKSENSEQQLLNRIHLLSDAGGAVIHVRTREPYRAAIALRKHMTHAGTPYKEWDVINGFRTFTKENYAEIGVSGSVEDFGGAFIHPLNELRNASSAIHSDNEKTHFFAYVDPHPFIENNPIALEMLQQYSVMLPSTNVCLLLITPDQPLPGVPVGTVMVADLPTPTMLELQSVLSRLLESTDDKMFDEVDISEEDMAQICNLGAGLTLSEFEGYVALSIIEASERNAEVLTADDIMTGVADGKTAVVRQSEVLELTHPESIDSVGGMGRLKDWLYSRRDIYSDEAREFGAEPPKGIVLVGVPGTGKSLVAKAASSVFKVPLVRLDLSRVFSKYVGDSESRVRAALDMVESMAPVVLFIDEIDKGLGGIGSGGDSGTSSRVLGTVLTWLQECKAPVFTVVTANKVTGLPPELLRRGRFSQIFSSTLPAPTARREVLAIHLRKRGRDIKAFAEADLKRFDAASEGYVPAEIEEAVKDAFILAFNDDRAKDIEMRFILDSLAEMIPMSKSHAAAINEIVQWAENNAISVEHPAEAATSTGGNMNRVIRPRRGVRNV